MRIQSYAALNIIVTALIFPLHVSAVELITDDQDYQDSHSIIDVKDISGFVNSAKQVSGVYNAVAHGLSTGDGAGAANRIILQDLIDSASADGGGVVYIPAGKYRFDSDASGVGLTIPNNVRVVGAGSGATILEHIGSSIAIRLRDDSNPNNLSTQNAGIENLRISAHPVGSTTELLSLFGARQCRFYNLVLDCNSKDMITGLKLEPRPNGPCFENFFAGIYITSWGNGTSEGRAIQLGNNIQSCNVNTFINVTAFNGYGPGIVFDEANSNFFFGLHVESVFDDYSIRLNNSSENTFAGYYFEAHGQMDGHISQSGDSTTVGNKFTSGLFADHEPDISVFDIPNTLVVSRNSWQSSHPTILHNILSLGQYTIASRPSAASVAPGTVIWVSDATSGQYLQISDGAIWNYIALSPAQ